MTRLPVEERRKALLEASVRVIERDGYTETTTRKIAAEAKMPLASLHYAFASRQELIAETLKLMSREIATAIMRSGQSGEGLELSDIFTACADEYVTYIKAHPGRLLAVLEAQTTGSRHSELAEISDGAVHRGALLYEYTIRRIAADYGIIFAIPFKDLASFLMSSLDGALLHWLASRDDEMLERSILALAAALSGMARRLEPAHAERQRAELRAILDDIAPEDILEGRITDFDKLI